MAFNHQVDLVDRQRNLLINPLPLTEEPAPEVGELELMTRQIEILFPVNMQGTLLTMNENISYMDVCLDGQQQIYDILRSAEAIDCFLRPLQGTGQTRLVDRLVMHQQALNAAAMRLHQDLTNFMQSLEHMGQPDGLEDRAWKM
ncbi:Hypothetical protein NCS54_01009100 [Fusarium falciforme]|uniref:Hypothetical protein n=1 Tax=Fusarium falciforme TaxID=195108 RepID=UPI0023013898|nr:Hypothetical protein NCS54_01009100 [Fusarium falciforme]WAO92576.1 Hypothetical protein NCS54_01009100 [Fusarium falciforme]